MIRKVFILSKQPVQSTPFTHEEFYKRYYVHRVAGAALVVKENKILLVKEVRKNNYIWGVPGGIIEKEEPLILGVIREVKEETGITIDPHCILGLNNWAGKSIFKEDPYNQCGFTMFLGANYVSGDLKPDGEEVIECGFYSIDEIEKMENFDRLSYIKEFYNSYINKNYLILNQNQHINHFQYRFTFSPNKNSF